MTYHTHDPANATHLLNETAARFFPDPEEHRRYTIALHRVMMGPITPARVATLARLHHKHAQVRAALRADPRLQRVRDPIRGPERFELKPQHRHAAVLVRRAET